MHIEDYEWVLYMHGDLSKKRESEMEAHMESCSQCLAAYVRITTGEKIETERNGTMIPRVWQQAAGRQSMRLATLAAIVLLVFIGVSFTPGGQSAWANIRQSLVTLGNSLTSNFGVEEGSEVITTVDLEGQTHNGVEIKVDQVFIEPDRIFFSIMVASDLIDEEHPYRLGIQALQLKIQGDEIPYVSQTMMFDPYLVSDSKTAENESIPVVIWFMEAELPNDYSQETQVPIQIHIKEMNYWDKHFGGATIIEGPWEFDFSVDGTLLARETRNYPLDLTFHEDDKEYAVQQLSISPVRTRMTVKRVNPLLYGQYEDENGVLRNIYITSINLTGFLIQDENGNEAEIATREYLFTENSDAKFHFSSDPAKNPYTWLKDAEKIVVTPYFVRLEGNTGQPGIKRHHPLNEGIFTIDLTEGGKNEK